MRKLLLILASAAVLTACGEKNEAKSETKEEAQEIAFATFGESFDAEEVVSAADAALAYEKIKAGDTIPMRFKARVNDVCQSKGCWMRLDLGEMEAMVKFKDYGFFVPKDIAGDEVIVEGVAFVDEMSVEDQKHFAEDAGKSQEEIEAITEPKRTLSFLSSGVLIAENQ